MLDRYDGEGYAVADAGEAAALAGELLAAGDVLLVKGSRGVGLEVVAEALAAGETDGPGRGPPMGEVLIAGTASLLICIFLSPKFISFLRQREFGQQIREDGPQEHHAKAGTPTMGGIIIFIAIGVPFLLLTDFDARSVGVFGTAMACALLGFADDYTKLAKRRSLGPARPHQADRHDRDLDRPVAVRDQVGGAARHGPPARCATTRSTSGSSTRSSSTSWWRGRPRRSTSPTAWTGWRRAAPRSSCSPTSRSPSPRAQTDLALVAGCVVGACVGFLWFNSFPASIFMGDTGSLGLGGAIAGMAVMTKTEVLLIILGGIFVIEALSVLIQVASFQAFRKRVFLMAPIHHHFELQAWSETKIILRFWIVAAVCSAIGFTLYQQSIS